MNKQQEALGPPRSKRRALGIFLLMLLPLAVAGTAGAAASNLAPAAEKRSAPLPATVTAQKPESTDIAPVLAPGAATEVDLTVGTPQINVSVPPPPPPEPKLQPLQRSTGSAGGGDAGGSAKPSGGSGSGKASGGSAKPSGGGKTAAQYCSSPQGPYSGGGGAKALLTAANKERARIGARALSWNGSLAAAATSWSTSMASRDSAGNGSALAHNPNRPGAENVAMAGSSAGMGVGTATARAHHGWMYSYGHCMNVMNPNYSSMGAGTATTANGKVVYTTANYR